MCSESSLTFVLSLSEASVLAFTYRYSLIILDLDTSEEDIEGVVINLNSFIAQRGGTDQHPKFVSLTRRNFAR